MLVSEYEQMRQKIRDWTAELGSDRSALIPVLQKIQKHYSCVSDYAMQVVADIMGIHPVEVYSVVTFYSFLNEHPKGRFVFRLCRTISCDMLGKDGIARQLENELGIGFGETSPDGRFTLEWTNCLGMCDLGPALMVNDRIYTQVTPARVHEIVEKCRQTFAVFALQDQGGVD